MTSHYSVVKIAFNYSGLGFPVIKITVAGLEFFVVQPYCLGGVVAEYLEIIHVELMDGDDGHGAILASVWAQR